jgi:hypothetical protein
MWYLLENIDTWPCGPNMKCRFCRNTIHWSITFHCCSIFGNQKWSTVPPIEFVAKVTQSMSTAYEKVAQCLYADFFFHLWLKHPDKPESSPYFSQEYFTTTLASVWAPTWHFDTRRNATEKHSVDITIQTLSAKYVTLWDSHLYCIQSGVPFSYFRGNTFNRLIDKSKSEPY